MTSDEAMKRRAYLGLGSNLGDSRQILVDAVETLRSGGEVVAVSSLYRTEPVGGPEQDPFLNLVVGLDTTASPQELLEWSRSLERSANRRRIIRWGPRTLDVDVLLVGDLTVDEEDLTVPHPRMFQRNFVMVPLLELDPNVVVEGYDPAIAFGDVENIGPLLPVDDGLSSAVD